MCNSLLIGLDRKQFKEWSRAGLVMMEGRNWDLGNWAYAVLFQLMSHLATDGTHDAILSFLDTLKKKWPSLAPEAPDSTASRSLKGDVIECVLAVSFADGPVWPEEVRVAKRKLKTPSSSSGGKR